ncbi:glycosyltransferase [Candidatus Saccharibacteria bacterium]|nr:MAG: glycosyltransferase [Candidatus Saccharibacteria bacterium]PID99166.1 MAG: glycosyltransferase [Candidatus Saccharibacteria bacterium]
MHQKNQALDLSVIIPFKDKAAMTLDCVRSLIAYGPPTREILLVSNNSTESELQKVTSGVRNIDLVKIIEYNHPFNYQKVNNWAVKQSTGETILFLNNDTELRPASRGLLERMFTKAHEKSVGIVGCLLLFGGEKTIQHAGVYLMPGGQADHLYVTKSYAKALKDAGSADFPYDISKDMPMSAVTGAVSMVQRKKFDAIKGFDERFIICGGDVDLCLRSNKKGYQTWYVGGGYILHKESQSRKFSPIPYNDFYWSYLSYIQGFDANVGDPFLPEITKEMHE